MVLNEVGLERMDTQEVVDVICLENGKMLEVNVLSENDKEDQTYNKRLVLFLNW